MEGQGWLQWTRLLMFWAGIRSAESKVDREGRGRFSVETTWGRTFEFLVKNIGEAREWVDIIMQAVAYWKVWWWRKPVGTFPVDPPCWGAHPLQPTLALLVVLLLFFADRARGSEEVQEAPRYYATREGLWEPRWCCVDHAPLYRPMCPPGPCWWSCLCLVQMAMTATVAMPKVTGQIRTLTTARGVGRLCG
jgi:hypothetical protein